MDEKSLTQKQERALEMVVRGCSDVEVARKVGVSRQIINSWRNHDTGFQYELEVRRQAVREKHQDKMNWWNKHW
jgi:FixJ family two-component response regulator